MMLPDGISRRDLGEVLMGAAFSVGALLAPSAARAAQNQIAFREWRAPIVFGHS